MILLYAVSYGGNTAWRSIDHRYRVGDYEGMKAILDTMSVGPRDTANWLQWQGQYYYWLSYSNPSSADTAMNCYQHALDYSRRYHRMKEDPVGYFYLHLGELSYLNGAYDSAIVYLDSARTAYPYRPGRYPHRDPSPVYKGLGMCYAMQGEYATALCWLDSCRQEYSGALSVDRMRAKVLALQGDYEASRKYYQRYLSQIRREVRDSFLTLPARDRETWWMSVRPFVTDCWRLEKAAPDLLYDVALLTKGILLSDSHVLAYTYADIRSALREGDVAIEWMTYERGGERRLGAVVLPRSGDIRFVETGRVADLEHVNPLIYDSAYAARIWSPAMMSAIGNARRVFFSPDGVLNQIGIEYLYPVAETRLYRLSSTRELIRRRKVDYHHATAMVIGGINYDAHRTDTVLLENDSAAYSRLCAVGGHASRLRYSLSECDSVIALRHHTGDTLVSGAQASEACFRTMAGRSAILHLSTHGYYRSAQVRDNSDFPRREVADRTMSESGLLFAGVNAELRQRSTVLDGIVSARELATMDMDSVDLCVVSACEGALGYISADGTYGIQRGLKAAGVGGMILSLWQVDDEATGELMRLFYQSLGEGKSVHDAFWTARDRLRLIEEVETVFDPATMCNVPGEHVRLYDKPYYYNAFILIDVL